MKKWNSVLCMLLALCLILGLVPAKASATETESVAGETSVTMDTETAPLAEEVPLEEITNELPVEEMVAGDPAMLTVTAGGTCGDNLTWTLDDEGTLTISGTGALFDTPWLGDERIKTVVFEGNVTSIGVDAFALATNLKSIVIPDSVTSIGDFAFCGCESLTSIIIPDSVTTIEFGAFADCDSLSHIELSDSLTSISNFMFECCESLLSVEIPNSVTSIGIGAFSESAVANIAIPPGVTIIGEDAFYDCTALTDIVFKGNAPEIGENAFYNVTATAYYPANNPTWSEAVMRNYGGNITWVPYESIDTIIQNYLVTPDVMLLIKPKLAEKTFLDAINIFVRNPELTVSSALGQEVIPDGGYLIKQEDAVKQDIVIKRNGYRDYIIPTEVSESFYSKSTDVNNGDMRYIREYSVYVQKDRMDGKPYLSTVFGRVTGEGNEYQELKHTELKLYPGDKHDIIISAVNMEGEHPTYYIAQDGGDHLVESETGIFSAVDLYNKLTYGMDVYAYAVTEGGIATEREKLMITKVPAYGDSLKAILESSTISLVGEKGQSIKIPEKYPLVGEAEISLATFQIPIGVYVHGSEVKISFGVDIFSSEKKPNTPLEITTFFENFKKSFKTMSSQIESADEELEMYRHFKKNYSSDYENYKRSKENFDIEFLGYGEGTIRNGELVFKEILLNVKGNFTFHYTQQGAVWVIPVYYYVEAGCEIGLSSQRARTLTDKNIPLDFGFLLDIEPELRVGGGAGVKDAISGGIYGNGSLPYTNNFSEQYHILKMVGEFGLEGEFFILKGDLSLLDGEYTLFESYYGSDSTSSDAMNSLAGNPTIKTVTSVASRDYAANTSEWLGGYPSISSFAVAANGVSFRDLQNSVFARSQPQVVRFGDGLLMVWVEDDPARDTYNRMRLVYSVYDPETDIWSEAQPVCDDGHNDAYPTLVSNGADVYVAWQKIDKTITEADCQGIDVLLETSEIYAAKFNAVANKFESAVKLTDNDLYEHSAVIDIENGQPVVYYASADGSEMNSAGKHTIYRHPVSGTAQAAASALNYILGITVSDGNISYVMDTDGDTSSTNDISVYTVADGNTSVFDKGENQVGYISAMYADFNGESTLFTTDLTNIYYMEDGERKSVFEYRRSMSGNINIAQTAAGTAILWTERVDGWNELFAVSYEDGAWTKPVKISSNGELLSNVDVTTLNGKLVGVCNTTAVSYSAEAGQYVSGETDLSFFTVNDFTDLSVSAYTGFDESTAVPGSEQTFKVMVSNKGTQTVKDAVFTLTDTLGTNCEETKTLNLIPGESQIVELRYPVPENYAGTVLEVNASVAGSRDAEPDNNTISIEIGRPDLVLTENTVHTFEDGYIVNITAANTSAVEATGVVLTVVLDEETNTPIHTQEIGELNRDTYISVDLALGKDRLSFDENGAAKVYVSVKSEQSDTDDTICLIITAPIESKECKHTETETVERREPDCLTAGHTAYERCTLCGEIVSGYEELAPIDHNFVEGVCSNCGESDPDYVPARLPGDVTGDGKVTATDYSRLLAHVKKVNPITDEAALKAADVTGDGKITATDYSRLLAHVKKVAPLW